jgi:OOP family OmpA-OmpF porin
MIHKCLKFNCLLGVLTLVFAAGAAQADGFAVGVSGARAPMNVPEAGVVGDASGWRVFGSYMFNKNFGVEAGLSKFEAPSGAPIPSNMHVDTEVYDVFAVVAYPIGEDLGLIGKVGYAAWNTETEVNDENGMHYKSRDLGLSFGGQYDISERFAVRGEFEWFESFASGELKYSLSGVFRFQ